MSLAPELPPVFLLGPWRVDTTTGMVGDNDAAVRLEPRVMAVLLDLAAAAGEVRSKEAIIEAVWGDTFVGEAALSRCISELRRVLGDDARDPKFIETLPKRGYRLVAEVRALVPDTKSLPGSPSLPPGPRPLWQTLLAAAIVAVFFLAWWQTVPERDDDRIETIAVLPLRALSDDADQRFFAEGLTEQLIANLATLESIRVVSGRAARIARDADADAGAIAASLGVDAVIDGTVQRSARHTLVSLELIAGRSERLVWGGSYQEGGDDWIEIGHEVAAQAAREIAVVLAALEDAPVTHVPTPAAQRELERGEILGARGGPVDSIRAVDHFRRAIELDPEFAMAWVQLAEQLATQAWNNWSAPESSYAEARSAAHTALDLQPTMAEAHAALAAIAAERNHDWLEAERRFGTAIELAPGSGYARERYARYLRRIGRVAAALEQSQAALAIDPGSLKFSLSHAWNLLLAGDATGARERFEDGLQVDDSLADAYAGLCAVANLEGRYDDAVRSCARAAAMPGHELELGALAFAQARSGDRNAATATLARMQTLDPTAAALAMATAYVGLGDTAAAITVLATAQEQRALWLPTLPGDPYLRELTSEPTVERIIADFLIPADDDAQP